MFNSNQRFFLKYFLFIYFALSLAIGLILNLFFIQERDAQVLINQANEKSYVELQKLTISQHLQGAIADLIFLSSLNELNFDYLSKPKSIRFLSKEYLEFLRNQKVYDQIRFLDRTGMEVVRVNFNEGNPEIVPENQLQSKANRYYFKETINLQRGQVYVSPFDLNVDNGQIERPIKPMIRFATPIFNQLGEKIGIVVLNYSGNELLNYINHEDFTKLGNIMLLNSEGYWLKSPNLEDEWGFMFSKKKDRTFRNQFPKAWQKINVSYSGQVETDRGLFTFITTYPILDNYQPQQIDPNPSESPSFTNYKSYYWKIVSHIPPDVLRENLAQLAEEMIRLYLMLLILVAIGSFFAAWAIVQRHKVQKKLRKSEAYLRSAYAKDRIKSAVSSQIRNSLELNEILKTSVEKIRELLKIDRCTFSWYCPNIDPPSWEVVQEAKTYRVDSVLGIYPIVDLGAFGKKLLNLETVQVDNVEILSDLDIKNLFLDLGFRSILMLPIQTRSRKLGLLTCGHCCNIRPWSHEDLELLTGVVEQLAIALEQAELYHESNANAAIAQNQAKQLQETLKKLQEAQTQLVQSEKMFSLGKMVAGVAHEINNPVSFIYGNLVHADEYAEQLFSTLDLYQKHYPNPNSEIENHIEEIELDFLKQDLPDLFRSMKTGAVRIRDIVESLRNFSRLDESEMKLVDLHEGIESTLSILQSRLTDCSNHQLKIDLVKQYGKISAVECHASQVNQVFMNIINNAIDVLESQGRNLPDEANRRLPTIVISTEQINSDFVTVTISDTGPGIPDRVREHIFDPFFTTKPVGQGTGLGLFISYDIIVQKHNGSLECISTPGQGTKFIINLPLHPAREFSTIEPSKSS